MNKLVELKITQFLKQVSQLGIYIMILRKFVYMTSHGKTLQKATLSLLRQTSTCYYFKRQ